MNWMPAQELAKSHRRRRYECHPLVEALESRWLLAGSPLTSWLNPSTDTPATVLTEPSPEYLSPFAGPAQLVGGTASSDDVGPARDFVAIWPSTRGVWLQQTDLAVLGQKPTDYVVLIISDGPRYLELAASFAIGGARNDTGAARTEAALVHSGEYFHFLPGPGARSYDSRAPGSSLASSDGNANADEYLLPVLRASSPARATMAASADELTASPSVAGSTSSRQVRATGPLSAVDLRAPALTGTSRGGADPSRGSGHFGRAGLLLASSLGPTVEVLPPSNLSSGGSDLLTTESRAGREVIAGFSEPAAPGDGASTPAKRDSALQEKVAAAHQGASLLTEGVTLGVTALERAVRALAEPMLESLGAPHDTLYWLGVSSWLLAATLACEAVRRRLPKRLTPAPALPDGASNLLSEDHA